MKGKFQSGFIAVIGRSNVGKSTLLNSMIGEKIAIVSDKPQTTRGQIRGILTREHYQIVFIDTPGIHRAKNKLSEYMAKVSFNTFNEVDVILLVVDFDSGIGKGDLEIMEMLKDTKLPVIVVLNKIDAIQPKILDEKLTEFQSKYGYFNFVGVSALLGTNLDRLENMILNFLEEGPKYYPDDMITDQPERVIISELIRERTLELLREEIPHGIGVEIISMEDREDKNVMVIHSTIHVEKRSHKGIVIGKNGQMLKKIGQRARASIEGLLGIKVYLELWVKVSQDWRNNQRALRDLGYDL
ncbi:MAG: GTPase Era [Clostridiales bacterium]|nr:GTPase Era [Clostridiales bacterium]